MLGERNSQKRDMKSGNHDCDKGGERMTEAAPDFQKRKKDVPVNPTSPKGGTFKNNEGFFRKGLAVKREVYSMQ